MKKLLFFLLTFPVFLFGQEHSWNGDKIAPNAKIRCLNIFVNIIYDQHPEYNGSFSDTTYWPPVTNPSLEGINNTAIPKYLLDWMDTVYVAGQTHGYCTRLYGESSFDSLQITGDFVVVNLLESTVCPHPWIRLNVDNIGKKAVKLINVNGLQTIYGHNKISDYDCNQDGKIDFLNLIIRNIKKPYAEINPGSGYGLPLSDSLIIEGIPYIAKAGTCQCVGDGDFYANPTNIVTHEISHSLFGDNDFHTSGGNHRGGGCSMSFLNIQGGYGLMGAAGSGLVSCNGYERWRMHWKHPQSVDYISARDAANTQSVASDITREDGNKTFLLRDFVTYGDVVRIKLPYKDSVTSSNQYIWLENHQVGSNNKLDFLQYSNIDRYAYCRPQGTVGIYAYYQIGRDVLDGADTVVWDSYDRDNLKIIPAEGYYDYEFVADTHKINCVNYETHYLAIKRNEENPLCGGQDQESHFYLQPEDTVLKVDNEADSWRKIFNNQNDDNLPVIGDTLDAFSTHVKINMGTNPSTNNAKTYHSNFRIIKAQNSQKNTLTTYLTGLSIEIVPIHGTGSFLVQVCWNDYNIINDTRWTGKISLKDTVILTTGNTITLVQNRTVAQPTRDPETGLFAGRTRWTCENGSCFRQDSASALILMENSSLTFEGGSRYELSKGARVEIHAGCSMTVRPGANVCLKGIVEVDSGGVFNLYDTAKMGNLSRLVVRPGGKLVVDGGTLTSACDDVMWQGIEVVGDPTKRQIPQWQGTVVLKNSAVIENAICGLRTGLREDTVTFVTTGGIISATNATFKNNRQSVVINSYAYTASSGNISNYNATFSRCTFTVDNSNLFATNNTGFAEHVRLWDVKGVPFDGCTFSNTTNNQYWNGRGINAADAGVLVNTYCPPQPTPVCECPETEATYSYFSGFTTAVEVTTSGNPYAVRIDEARFSNNSTGVKINGNHFATVTRCRFNLDQHPGRVHGNMGLELEGCSGYTVEENDFQRTTYPTGLFVIENSTGIGVSNSGISDNSLYRSNFLNLTRGISVTGENGHHKLGGGLQMTCNYFNGNKYDISLATGATACYHQGNLSKGADNEFHNTSNNVSNFYNPGFNINYYYFNGGMNLIPANSMGLNLTAVGTSNTCPSTLCNGGIPNPGPVTSFASQVSAYTATAGNANTDGGTVETQNLASLQTMQQSLSETYYTAVLAIMSDTVLDLNELEMWHTAAQPIADPYSLTETRFMEGYAEIFAENAETDAEMANYADFHALKLALRGVNDGIVGANNHSPLQTDGHINWYALTPAQIAQLQTIAERNTGRASVMAKGVLCFFHGICYEDEWDNVGAFDTPQQGDDTTGTRAKHIATDNPGDAALSVYPNPTDDLLFIELRGGAEIANVALYDLQGRIVTGVFDTPQQGGTATIIVKSIPAGVYVLRVTDADGREYHRKIVRK